jgi:hypothetical protein
VLDKMHYHIVEVNKSDVRHAAPTMPC